jgi:catechol 2,3-dioxygenase-like lactoylglutathione lyase family enzyme
MATTSPASPTLPRWRFDHVNLRSGDSAPLQRLFGEVLGLRSGYRPPFRFPGDWLYHGDEAWLHLVRAPALGAAVQFAHIAFRTDEAASALLARLRAAQLPHEVAVVPEQQTVQIFVRLPGDFVVELDAPADAAVPHI